MPTDDPREQYKPRPTEGSTQWLVVQTGSDGVEKFVAGPLPSRLCRLGLDC